MPKRSCVLLLAFALLVPVPASTAGWPDLARQLRDGGVAPGSALAALIAAHQDASGLDPAEAGDHVPLPLWLRVLWREAHPGMVYVRQDPMGGYPRTLRDVHTWLLTHQDLRPGRQERAAGPGKTPGKAAVISGETRISGAQTSPRSTSDIRVNPWDLQKIIAASNNITASGAQAQHYSLDGGATWGQSSLRSTRR